MACHRGGNQVDHRRAAQRLHQVGLEDREMLLEKEVERGRSDAADPEKRVSEPPPSKLLLLQARRQIGPADEPPFDEQIPEQSRLIGAIGRATVDGHPACLRIQGVNPCSVRRRLTTDSAPGRSR